MSRSSGASSSSDALRTSRPSTVRVTGPRRGLLRGLQGRAGSMRSASLRRGRRPRRAGELRRHARHLSHPARRRRGIDPDAAHVPARAGRLQGGSGARRGGSVAAVRRGVVRPGRARHHAAPHRRPRGLPPAAGDEHCPDHHAHGPRRRARHGARARARRGRLHHQALLDPGVPQPRARPPATSIHAARRRSGATTSSTAATWSSTSRGARSRCVASTYS